MFVKSHCDLVKFEPEPESDRAESSKTIVFCESEHSVLRRFDKLVKPRAESFEFSMIVLRLWLFVTSWNSRKANERESSESFDRRLKACDILISCVQDWLNLQLLNSLFRIESISSDEIFFNSWAMKLLKERTFSRRAISRILSLQIWFIESSRKMRFCLLSYLNRSVKERNQLDRVILTILRSSSEIEWWKILNFSSVRLTNFSYVSVRHISRACLESSRRHR